MEIIEPPLKELPVHTPNLLPVEAARAAGLEPDPFWYKRGVIYEVHVRAFHDSNADGTGDFRGLTAKLGYLRDLGVAAIWVLPFYPSPLKDDGYDIADYYGVHPMYGTLGDFKTFLRTAHRYGLRVITELVLNHTSDQHPWFQRARHAKPGSAWRNYYVWSDTAEKYQGTRVIFKDTETSNWAWDHVANAYFWHRFYSHQPDLNFDNPSVRLEMIRVLDFWLGLGVDGVRLDAVPYLYERPGTSCENLLETHAFLKTLRKHVDEKYADRMLLAEANQWPDDAVSYFGSGRGDECHMAFHFPLMPRLFMSLRMEDRVPIVDILQQTPAIPETAQWALFLRNHDELTLEMVTDEERDYMYRMYAQTYQARLNLGIRRRLAPLLGNDRRRIELMNALLFSLPGTPVIYYGDEIGLGENIFLGDRNGVRTPMQWSADRNAGFSRANPQSLYLPINLDPENHYEAVNVDVQQRNAHSLLWWMKRLIALHKRWKAFGLGSIEFLHPENRKILAYTRRYQEECVLVVANLSRFVQPVALDLSAFRGLAPIEIFGRAEFPAIGEAPYFLTLGPHAFYWLSLEAKEPARAEAERRPGGADETAALRVEEDWEEVFHERHHLLLEQALQNWLPSRPWFAGKDGIIKAVHLAERVPLAWETGLVFLAFIQIDYVQLETETYVVPLACALGSPAEEICRGQPGLAIVRLKVTRSDQQGILYDAIGNLAFCQALLDIISRRRTLGGSQGEMAATHTAFLRQLRIQHALELAPSPSVPETGNSRITYGDRLILKWFRRVEPGLNPDLDLTRFLTARKFPYTPPLAGAWEYRTPRNEPATVAVLSSFVPKCQTTWQYTLDVLTRFYDRVGTLPAEAAQPPLPSPALTKRAASEPPAEVSDMIGTYLESIRILAETTAALHRVLASETKDPSFTPEAFTAHYRRSLFESFRGLTRQTFQLLNQRLKSLPAEILADAQKVLGLEGEILARFRAVYQRGFQGWRIRIHGDYQLGKVLYTGKEFLIADFDGGPARSLSEGRLKECPLRDVASLIHSIHAAAQAALLKQIEHGALEAAQATRVRSWGQFWARWVSAVFYRAYRQYARKDTFLPGSDDDLGTLLEIYLLRRAVSELSWELNRRPDWLHLPLQAILEAVSKEGHP